MIYYIIIIFITKSQ